jgi:hypothetical protein
MTFQEEFLAFRSSRFNDFGIAGVDAPTQLWVLRLADQLPLKK